jgi:hypothetical protein
MNDHKRVSKHLAVMQQLHADIEKLSVVLDEELQEIAQHDAHIKYEALVAAGADRKDAEIAELIYRRQILRDLFI